MRINSYTKATQGQLFVLEFQIVPPDFWTLPHQKYFYYSVFEQDYTDELCLFSLVCC